MKISPNNKPTNTIAIKAHITSEWDHADFAILHFTPEWVKLMRDRLMLVESMTETSDRNFYHIAWFDTVDGYYQHGYEENIPETHCIEEDQHYKEHNWCYVELEKDEQDKFIKPEQCIDYETVKIYDCGSVKFTATGKHTGEPIWTSRFPISKIINDYDSNAQ